MAEDTGTAGGVTVGNWASVGVGGAYVGVITEFVVGSTRVAVAVAGVVGCAIEVDPDVAVSAIRVADGKGVTDIVAGTLTKDGLGSGCGAVGSGGGKDGGGGGRDGGGTIVRGRVGTV